MKSQSYVVTWSVDIFDAKDPEDAARQALAMMLRLDSSDPDSATVFNVSSETENDIEVDLSAIDTKED